MGPKVKAVADSGPIIHLREIGAEKALSVFSVVVPPAVAQEVKGAALHATIDSNFDNNLVQILQNEFNLGLAESQCIALAKARNIQLLLTDDLEARTTAKNLGLEPHGTVGILLRAYHVGIFSKKQSIGFVQWLKSDSTLYITTDLILHIIREIEKK